MAQQDGQDGSPTYEVQYENDDLIVRRKLTKEIM